MCNETVADFYDRFTRRKELDARENKSQQRETIEEQIKAFQQRGGQIKQIDSSVGAAAKPVIYNSKKIGVDILTPRQKSVRV